jgi:hypothetical protein
MALPGKIGIRTKETTKTTGTGAYSLEGATFGCQTFVGGVGDGEVALYCCSDVDVVNKTGNWEVGYGTVTDGTPDTLTRTVVDSSNGGSAVDWGDGTRDIYSTFVDSGILVAANNLSDLSSVSNARTNLGLGTAAVKNEGPGNGLDADTVDGVHAADFVDDTSAQTIAGNKTFSDDMTMEGDLDIKAILNLNAATTGRLVLPVGVDRYATV